MGEEVTLNCGNCHRSQHLMIGSGMIYNRFSLEDIYKMARGKVKEEVAQFLNRALVKSNQCEEALLACPKCETLTTRFSFQLFDEKGKCLYQSKFRCSKCKRRLKPACKEMTSYRCRYCFSPSLSYGDFCGFWD